MFTDREIHEEKDILLYSKQMKRGKTVITVILEPSKQSHEAN